MLGVGVIGSGAGGEGGFDEVGGAGNFGAGGMGLVDEAVGFGGGESEGGKGEGGIVQEGALGGALGEVGFIAQFEQDALGALFADAGNAGQSGKVVLGEGSAEFGGGQGAEDGEGEFGADAVDAQQEAEVAAFVGGGKAVEFPRILADGQVGKEGGARAEGGQGGGGL